MNKSDLWKTIQAVLDHDHLKIAYHACWSSIPERKQGEQGKTIGPLGAILLQQVRFRWKLYGEKPFYKFFTPAPDNRLYRTGDSWLEEVGFESKHILSSTFQKLGRKLNGEEIGSWRDVMVAENLFVSWFQDKHHVTWWYFNERTFIQCIALHYSRLENKISIADYFAVLRGENIAISDDIYMEAESKTSTPTELKISTHRVKNFNPDHDSEITTEKNHIEGDDSPPDYLDHVFGVATNPELALNPELGEPGDWEKFFGARDECVKIVRKHLGFNNYSQNEILKFTGEHVGSEDIAAFEKSIVSAVNNWSGRGKVPWKRITEVYLHGRGDYEKFAAWKWGGESAVADIRTDEEKARLREALKKMEQPS